MLLLLAHVVEGNATRVDATTIYTIDAHKRTRNQEIELELEKSKGRPSRARRSPSKGRPGRTRRNPSRINDFFAVENFLIRGRTTRQRNQDRSR